MAWMRLAMPEILAGVADLLPDEQWGVHDRAAKVLRHMIAQSLLIFTGRSRELVLRSVAEFEPGTNVVELL